MYQTVFWILSVNFHLLALNLTKKMKVVVRPCCSNFTDEETKAFRGEQMYPTSELTNGEARILTLGACAVARGGM